MVMKTRIEVNGIRLKAYHGVDLQERRVGNIFEVTVHVDYPMEEAMVRDNVSATLNYAALVEVVKDVMALPSALLENVVLRLYNALMSKFRAISGGMIRIAKINPPIGNVQLQDVAVVLEW